METWKIIVIGVEAGILVGLALGFPITTFLLKRARKEYPNGDPGLFNP
jgi:uncharacterized protein YneF (UPF0154 family)